MLWASTIPLELLIPFIFILVTNLRDGVVSGYFVPHSHIFIISKAPLTIPSPLLFVLLRVLPTSENYKEHYLLGGTTIFSRSPDKKVL